MNSAAPNKLLVEGDSVSPDSTTQPPELPIQPIIRDKDGVTRFQANAIVSFLLDWASSRGMDLNALAIIPFPNADREQFAMLIGYSLCGFSELSYVSDETYERADAAASLWKEVVPSPVASGDNAHLIDRATNDERERCLRIVREAMEEWD